jgi:hypothetical protein
MDEGEEHLFEYVGILALICLLICGLVFPSIDISRDNFKTRWDAIGTIAGLLLSVIGSTFFIVFFVFWLVMKYQANKSLYSLDEVFPQKQVCEDTTLINEQMDSVVSI